jgi:hypothetical protein
MSRTASIFSFARTIADKRADVVRTRETINALASQADTFAPVYAVANTIAKFCKANDFGKYVYANPTSWGVGFNSLHVSIDDTVDSLSTGKIPAIVEFILEMGLNAKKSRDYADTSCASRSYNFETKIGGVEFTLTIEANIKDDSETCKRVQTGVEIKEVAKYEIVCS